MPGDIICLRVFGYTFVVLNSARDVHEILVKRGRQCAARMRYVMYEQYVAVDALQRLLMDCDSEAQDGRTMCMSLVRRVIV